MPLYRCPKCGRTVELPEGTYYCEVCGPETIMQKVSEVTSPMKEQYRKLIKVLDEASNEAEEAWRTAIYFGEFSEIHSHIQRAHEKLREASRIMGYKPSAK